MIAEQKKIIEIMPALMNSVSIITFPFERTKAYSLNELESFEKNLLNLRQDDSELSATLRYIYRSESRWVKRRNEELVPFLYLARHKHWPKNTTFKLTSEGDAVDIEASTSNETTPLQITIADAIGQSQHSEHHLKMRELHHNKISHGWNTDSENGVNTDKLIQDHKEGLRRAFENKKNHGDQNTHLLVYARRYNEALSLPMFQSVVDTAVQDYKDKMRFKNVYIVTPDSDYYYESRLGI